MQEEMKTDEKLKPMLPPEVSSLVRIFPATIFTESLLKTKEFYSFSKTNGP